jgi:hypothetical protein
VSTNVSGLVALVNAVTLDFAKRGIASPGGVPVQVLSGLKNRSLWSVPRVVFIPGKFDGTLPPKPLDEGRLVPPEHTKADNPRELATWERLVTCSVYTVDETDIQNDLLQVAALDSLVESTLQSIWNAFTPNVAPIGGNNKEYGYTGQASIAFTDSPVTRIYPGVEFTHGGEILFTFTQKGPFFDVPIPTVTPTVIVMSKSYAQPSPSAF